MGLAYNGTSFIQKERGAEVAALGTAVKPSWAGVNIPSPLTVPNYLVLFLFALAQGIHRALDNSLASARIKTFLLGLWQEETET